MYLTRLPRYGRAKSWDWGVVLWMMGPGGPRHHQQKLTESDETLGKKTCVVYGCFMVDVFPRNLRLKRKIMVSKGLSFSQGLVFRLHVKFRGCMYVTCTLIWCCQGVRDEAYWRDLISKDRFCSELQSFWIPIGNRVRHWHCIFFGEGSHEHLELVKFQQFMHFFYSLVNDGLFLNCGMFCSKLSTSWPCSFAYSCGVDPAPVHKKLTGKFNYATGIVSKRERSVCYLLILLLWTV